MIESLAEVKPANKCENGFHNENNEDSKKDLQLNIQQEDLTTKDKEPAGKKREVKAAEKEQEEVQKQKESPIVQDQAQDGEAIEPSVDKDITDTGESNERKKQKVSEEEASCD